MLAGRDACPGGVSDGEEIRWMRGRDGEAEDPVEARSFHPAGNSVGTEKGMRWTCDPCFCSNSLPMRAW
jgi:hypothetical protein